MELRSVALFTVDSKDGKILEMNPLQESAIKTLNKAHGGNFTRAQVSPFVKSCLPDRHVMQPPCGRYFDDILDEELDMLPEDWNGVLIPEAAIGSYAVSLNQERPLTIANADPLIAILFKNKGLQFDIATDVGGKSVPKTRNYDAHRQDLELEELAAMIREDFKGVEKLVIKPVDEKQGQGVVIVDRGEIERELRFLLTRPMFALSGEDHYGDGKFAEQYWRQHTSGLLQVQEFHKDRPIRHKGKQWDATRRYAGATVVTIDDDGRQNVQTAILGGFAKLPREPIPEDGAVTQNNRISYSKSHGLTEGLTHFFLRVTSGSGDRILLSQEEVEADTAEMVGDLNRIFARIDDMDIAEYAEELAKSNDPARNRLARSISGWMQEPTPVERQDQRHGRGGPDDPEAV